MRQIVKDEANNPIHEESDVFFLCVLSHWTNIGLVLYIYLYSFYLVNKAHFKHEKFKVNNATSTILQAKICKSYLLKYLHIYFLSDCY